MAYYENPEEMFRKRAEKSKRMGARHWAQAKNGEGKHHYCQAKHCYQGAKENLERAEKARKGNNRW